MKPDRQTDHIADHIAGRVPGRWLEQLEARIVLSNAYYAWTGVDTLPGYDASYGASDTIVGASDDGRFLWSQAAADPDARGETDEPYLVADGQMRYLRDIAPLADAAIGGINSDGLVFARDVEGQDQGRLFLLDLLGSGQREYLDQMQLDAPDDFNLAALVPTAITDGAGLVLQDEPGSGLQLWAIVDQVVTKLWRGSIGDVNASNGVVGQARGDHGNSTTPSLWTPDEGLIDLSVYDISLVAALDNSGWLFCKAWVEGDPELVFWRQDEVRRTGLRDDGERAYSPLDADAEGRMIVHSQPLYGKVDSVSLVWLDGEARIVVDSPSRAPVQYSLTESGLLLNSNPNNYSDSGSEGGWYRPLPVADMVRSVAGESAAPWVQGDTVVVSYRDAYGGVTQFHIEASGHLDWGLPVTSGEFDGGSVPRGFVDPSTGASVCVTIARGKLYSLLVDQPDGFGNHRDWFASIWGSITGNPFAYFLPGGNPVYGGLDDDGRVRLLYHLESRGFIDSDLSQHLDSRGLETPEFVSDLEAFRTSWGAMNIVGLDANGDVHAVWWAPGLRSPMWTTTNLSELTGAPRLTGNLAATATPWGGMQIHGTDERGHLVSLWWSPATGRWQATDLTAEVEGPALRAGSLDIATGRFGSINLVAATDDGEVVCYWWSRASGWEAKAVIEADDAPRFSGPASYFVARSGEQHIAGVRADGHVLDFYWQPGADGWQWQDLTALASG
jgi:hypothetical protein